MPREDSHCDSAGIRMIRPATASELDAVLDVVRTRPKHFTPDAHAFIREDFCRHPSLVWEEGGSVQGFITWMASAYEMELLWLAVRPTPPRQGMGKSLMHAAMRTCTTQKIIVLKTTSPDSTRADYDF